jgi:carboxyl-terminal processing protease
LRNGEELTFTLTRQVIRTQVAAGEMLDGNIGLVSINNFNDRCAQETKAAIESLIEQGATSLIFDLRNNPGGYKHELVNILDYLLPEGDLFHSVDYSGKKETDTSDAKCL